MGLDLGADGLLTEQIFHVIPELLVFALGLGTVFINALERERVTSDDRSLKSEDFPLVGKRFDPFLFTLVLGGYRRFYAGIAGKNDGYRADF
jgi:hypothetical protein